MDKMYKDFTTKMLPTIQQGLSITKDYFLDLFGRYVKYLIISDSIALAIWTVVLIVSVIIFVKYFKKSLEAAGDYDTWPIVFWVGVVAGILGGIIGVCINLNWLVQDFYVPEIRIYQELQSFKSTK